MSHPKKLPLDQDVETKAILRKSALAHRYLAELKGAAATIPNEAILINTLGLQEAKDSSEVEQIITTHDELYRAEVSGALIHSPAAKEVKQYAEALLCGFRAVKDTGLIRSVDILEMNRFVTSNDAGYRRLPGTSLMNDQTGEVVYTPPQDAAEVEDLMTNLVEFINDPSMCNLDPLVKMAIIHHQFESIHPFYDGNGRTGRILNILYLVAQDLLGIPILYLSRFVVRNKAEYYELLQSTRDSGDWEAWIIFILTGIAETAQSILRTVRSIESLMMKTKHQLRSNLPRIYSQDLLNNIFRHPYTKIGILMEDLRISRPTASSYLHAMVTDRILTEEKLGRSKYFVNLPLVRLLLEAGARSPTVTDSIQENEKQ